MKKMEEKSKVKVQELESENHILKEMLIEEEKDDVQMAETMEEKISLLKSENNMLRQELEAVRHEDKAMLDGLKGTLNTVQTENQELRGVIRQLHLQMKMNNDLMPSLNDNHKGSSGNGGSEMNVSESVARLRQKINHIVAENEDLKTTIARLRYAKDSQDDHYSETQEVIIALVKQLKDLQHLVSSEQEQSLKWRERYESEKAKSQGGSSLYSWFQGQDIRKFFEDSVKNGSEIVGDWFGALKTVLDSLLEGAASFETSEQAREAKKVVQTLQESLNQKWTELSYMNVRNDLTSQKIVTRMASLLTNTLRKLQDSGDKFFNAQKPMENRINKFSSKVEKITESLELKWIEITNRLYKKLIANDKDESEEVSEEKEADWYWERGVARKESSLGSDIPDRNWALSRGQDRERQRIGTEHYAVPRRGSAWRTGRSNPYEKPDQSNGKSKSDEMRQS